MYYESNFGGYSLPTHDLGYGHHPEPQCYELDYRQDILSCNMFCKKSESFKHVIISKGNNNMLCIKGVEFTAKVTFESCDLSGVTLHALYFQEGASFEGCILQGTKFERVGGLVRHKVHFAPWQVAQADFEPELLQALKDNSCIY